jgi:hypothetical protein
MPRTRPAADEAIPSPLAPLGFPSPLWGGARGGGNPESRKWGGPPTLSLAHKGGGDAAALASLHFFEARLRPGFRDDG